MCFLGETYQTLTIGGRHLYEVYDIATQQGIIRVLRKNGKPVGAFRRGEARELAKLLLGGTALLTVNEFLGIKPVKRHKGD